jgi:hypothetical protein
MIEAMSDGGFQRHCASRTVRNSICQPARELDGANFIEIEVSAIAGFEFLHLLNLKYLP